MILYLTLILKYWQYIVIALCSIAIVALLIRCNILDERNTSLKKTTINKNLAIKFNKCALRHVAERGTALCSQHQGRVVWLLVCLL